jgi:hypothetical protein
MFINLLNVVGNGMLSCNTPVFYIDSLHGRMQVSFLLITPVRFNCFIPLVRACGPIHSETPAGGPSIAIRSFSRFNQDMCSEYPVCPMMANYGETESNLFLEDSDA